MTIKQSHIILLLVDLFCLWGIWFCYSELQLTLSEVNNQDDIIRFNNRAGFFILGIGGPLFHLLPVMNYFWPEIQKKYNVLISNIIVVLVVVLFTTGFMGSSWIKSRVENAGYIYCHNASGVNVLAKTLVYTKDMNICEDLVGKKRAGLK